MKKNPLAQRREELGFTQEQMASLLKTVQSEISKTEAGELPPDSDRRRWAKAYRLPLRKFEAKCDAARWVLPLWKTAYESPQDIEEIDCRTETRVLAAIRRQNAINEGRIAVLYEHAPIIGETEQKARQA